MESEVLRKGKVYRILADAANEIWDKISFFTHADDVEFSDGQSASAKLSAINGITSELTCEDESIALSAAAGKQLNDSVKNIKFTSCFADYTKIIHTINKKSTSWVATEDCLCLASITPNVTSNGGGNSAAVKIDCVTVFSVDYKLGNGNIRTPFYVKKGQTVATTSYGTYDLTFYALF
jgi:hypothetical protein